jgi:hypothetical protein
MMRSSTIVVSHLPFVLVVCSVLKKVLKVLLLLDPFSTTVVYHSLVQLTMIVEFHGLLKPVIDLPLD